MKKKVGIVGFGYVGKSMYRLFPEAKIYDKFQSGYNSLESKWDVNDCDLAIVCVPTPSNREDLSCNTSIVEDVVKWIKAPLILIKSTIPPGTTDYLKKKYGKRICFSPEYVGEGGYYVPEWKYPHPVKIETHTFLIVGGDKKDTSEIIDIFQEKLGPTKQYVQTTTKTAELTKYMENIWGAMKVTFSNEFYDIAKSFGVDYNELRELFLLDGRTERMHTSVFPNKRGFAGKCLVAGTKLRTDEDKFIDVEDVGKGDKIFNGNFYDLVTKIAKREVRETIEIRARGRKIQGSFDHIHIIYDEETNQLKEIELKDIKVGDWIFVPQQAEGKKVEFSLPARPNNYVDWIDDKIIIDRDWARLIGLYLAEGCMSQDYSVIWSFGEKEEYLADEVVSILKNKGIRANKKLQVSNGTYGLSTCWIVRVRLCWLQEAFRV